MADIRYLLTDPEVFKKLQENLRSKCPDDFARIMPVASCGKRILWGNDPKCKAITVLIRQIGKPDYINVRKEMIETLKFLSKINDNDEQTCSFEFFRSIPTKYLAGGFLGYLLLGNVVIRTRPRFVYKTLLFFEN